ncbi:hypothetical protein ACK8GG_04195 [Micromonosporaceae bacterium DT55]|uniref:hypothetical protein n=1 Tax=Melissospora conviva TaxID=3388432 RepID=UPI003C1D40B3
MSELSALNDLFTGDDEPEGTQQRRGSALGGWIRSALGVAALTVVTIVLLRVGGVAVPLIALVAGWSAVLLLRRVAASVSPPPVHGRRPDDDAGYGEETEDGMRAAVKRWERRLSAPDRFQQVSRSMFTELVDERLRQRHGLTRAGDPERARKLLGDRLWTFLDKPPRRHPAPKDYAALIAEVEKI